MVLDIPKRFRALGVIVVAFIYLFYFYTNRRPVSFSPSPGRPAEHGEIDLKQPGHLKLLTSSELRQTPEWMSESCALRYDDAYLRAFNRRHANYCSPESVSQLECFSHGAPGKQIDTFCAGGPYTLSAQPATFNLNCTLRAFSVEENSLQLPQYNAFPSYWYGTGPRAIFNSVVKLASEMARSTHKSAGYAFLIKREDNNQNMWHTMMEIMSLTMSIDVLSITNDDTGRSFFTDEDRARSQVVLLDSLPDGPYFDLWSIFSGLKTIRLADLEAQRVKPEKILLPLPGGSNPFWAGDWEMLDCGTASLFRRYSDRVLAFYGINARPVDKQVRLTYISRKQKRRLVNEEQYFEKLKSIYPQVSMQMVDYAALDFAKQIELSHNTDILVGVHGAGLTHGAFMPEGSVLVEILPKELNHKGFRNMAQFLGHLHFGAHAEALDSPESNGDWQHDDLVMPESKFVDLVSQAINHALSIRMAG